MSKKIKSGNLNKRKKLLSNKVDTVYMNTDTLFFYDDDKKLYIGNNINNIIISKKLVEEDSNYVSIYESSASNLSFEGQANYGDITIPIDYICEEKINLGIENYNRNSNFKKINIVKDEKILLEINIDNQVKDIDIRKDSDYHDLYIHIITKKDVIEYYVNKDGTYLKNLYRYYITKDDLDENNNLDIRSFKDYENLSCDVYNINTLIVDKNIFNNFNTYYDFGLLDSKDYKINIKNIRFVENNDMKLIPFDKTFEIEKILLHENNLVKYLYIETKDDEVVIYPDKGNIKYISKNELLKDESIKNVYFRFRKQSNYNGGILKPINLIVKEFKDGKICVDNLIKEFEIDDNFKNNIKNNIDELKLFYDFKDYILNNNWLELLLDNNFDDNLYRQLLLKHIDEERNLTILKRLGFKDSAIEYLKLKGIIDIIIKSNISDIEVKGYNEIGENYKKVLKK